MRTYLIVHPGSGTIMMAEETYAINVADIPLGADDDDVVAMVEAGYHQPGTLHDILN